MDVQSGLRRRSHAGEKAAVTRRKHSFNRKSPRIAFLLALLSLTALPVQAADVEFSLRIERGRVPANMRIIRVKQGDNVTLRWSTDRATVVHLHGYDIEKK